MKGCQTGFLPCKEKAFTQLLGLQFTPDVCLSFQPFSFSPILLFPSPVSHLANSHWASVVTIWIQTLANSVAWAQASAFPALTMCLGMDSSHTHTECRVVNLGRKAGLFIVLGTWRTGDK